MVRTALVMNIRRITVWLPDIALIWKLIWAIAVFKTYDSKRLWIGMHMTRAKMTMHMTDIDLIWQIIWGMILHIAVAKTHDSKISWIGIGMRMTRAEMNISLTFWYSFDMAAWVCSIFKTQIMKRNAFLWGHRWWLWITASKLPDLSLNYCCFEKTRKHWLLFFEQDLWM